MEEVKNKEEIVGDASTSDKVFSALLRKMSSNGIKISDFKELFNIQTTDENLERLKISLTLKKVLSDYLSLIVHIAFKKLEVSDEIKKSRYFNDFNEANSRYCFVCPKSLRDYMTECFVDAGLIQEHEVNQRLSFVTEVEAVAYNLLSLSRISTELTPNQSYLVCNVSENAFGIAEINVDTTESLSTVELIYESSNHGSMALQANLRDYLKTNSIALNLNNSIIDDMVTDFTNRFKDNLSFNQSRTRKRVQPDHRNFNSENPNTNAFTNILDADKNPITITLGDLNRVVHIPFIKHLTQHIIDSFKSLENRKLILSGKYCHDPYFMDFMLYNSGITYLEHASILYDIYVKESFGAVSAALRINEFQLPILLDTAVDETENDIVSETENINQGFDFLIGIDFGSSYAGCSYVDLRNGENVIKTIKADDWPGGGFSILDKIPTLLLSKKITQEFTAWGKEVNLQAVYDENASVCAFLRDTVDPDYRGIKQNEEALYYYLMRLNEHVKEFIIENETKGKMKIEKYQFRYVMTLPDWWDDSARYYLVEAAIKAQIIQENEINLLTLITEPDAAMFFCKNLLYNYFGDFGNFGSERKTFILCDAGGYSTELFTYHCHVQAGELNFFQILESSRGGDGSIRLNENFKDYLESIYIENSDTHGDFEDMVSEETLDYFENVYKPLYMQYLTDDDDGYHDFNLDGSTMLNGMRIPASMEKNIFLNDNTTLRIRNEDMKTDIVDPVVNNVLSFIKQQCKKTEDNRIGIEGIIMVGGFSQSKYLQKQVKKEFRGVYKVIFPDEPINAFSRGAVEYALKPFDILEGYMGLSLSLEVQKPLKRYDLVQPSCLKSKGPDGRYYLKNYQQYFVKEGQKIKRKKLPHCFSQLITVEYPKSAVIAIYSTQIFNYEEKHLTKIAEIRLNVPPTGSGIKNGDMIEYKVTVTVFDDEAVVQISYGNHDILFDGPFPLKKNIMDYYKPDVRRVWDVLIDNYLVIIGRDARYYIDKF
ncbi:uncharacterized protein EV154DRAFT_497662 [Mucor mucedo]|uniref:uncharacterized protein n=1 Tax=Mucor mucedo TaxID=29922 RepID=UPI00221ED47C|nr:uncharacterized protein EV154DRAFT_497662 [Mucor mucedo]KAI7894713.1 hypothetical protein EV154DRAFT_497662 [Mucor mucedo]